MRPPGPIFMLVMDEGKCGVVLLWLRCCHTPPSKTTLNLPFAELTKLRISSSPPSARRRFVVMPAFWRSFSKFWQMRCVPLPVMTTSFVVEASAGAVPVLPATMLPSWL